MNISPGDAKIIYLTFDDGPINGITDKLLDVLKQKDVRATFFVVGKEIKGREMLLKRIYTEGHSIGLHTYSHNLKKIYKNEDAFIEEMRETRKLINEIVGFSPNIIRFPGGSSHHLTLNMLSKLHANRFNIYDWNVSIGDGIDANLSPNKLLKNSKAVKNSCHTRIILMHTNSNNINTVKALPEIINYYKNEGYIFMPITDTTPEYYYRIK